MLFVVRVLQSLEVFIVSPVAAYIFGRAGPRTFKTTRGEKLSPLGEDFSMHQRVP